jgi:GNAT superfamily N-acetyltransferase
MIEIKFIPKKELASILPFLEMLDKNIDKQILIERLSYMKETGYQCVGVYNSQKLIGISGLWILCKYYVGKHIELDNVIIHPDYRGKRIGEQMMQWIHNYAKSIGCTRSELNCYVRNSKGLKFYMNCGYEMMSFHLKKNI